MFNFILPKMILRVEKWKWNKEYRVYVSNMGNFKDEHKNNLPMLTGEKRRYLSVKTPYGIKLAHRLVMMTWKPIPNAEDLTVDHLNHNTRDNSIYNLEWVTAEENIRRAEADKISAIKTNELKFRNAEDIYNWCLENKSELKNNPDARNPETKKKIIKKIEKAVQNNTIYFGRKWEYSK